MNCDEFQDAWHAALDDRRAPPPELWDAHAAECPACAALWHGGRVWQRGLGAPGPSARFVAETLSRLEIEQRVATVPSTPRPGRLASALPRLAAVAAMLLLTVLAIRATSRARPGDDVAVQPAVPAPSPAPPVVPSAPPLAPAAPAPAATPLVELVASARNAYAGLAQHTLGTLQDASLLAPPRPAVGEPAEPATEDPSWLPPSDLNWPSPWERTLDLLIGPPAAPATRHAPPRSLQPV